MDKFPYDLQSGDTVIAKFVNESDAEISLDAILDAFPDADLSINDNT